jgi:serine/threonine-protein kinase
MASEVCSLCGSPFEPGALACAFDGTPVELEPTRLSDPLIGQRLGDYRIEGRLGVGGMGIVYSGVQVQIGKRVAVKVLRPDLASEPAQVQRLLQEAQAVNAIRHRGIIDIFGFGELPDGRHYVVMEELEGESLEALLQRRGALPLGEARVFLDELLSALSAAHARGVIHRDLKPGNLFVVTQSDGTRFLKVLDFGLAKRAQKPGGRAQQTSQLSVSGTPEYMAPEQVRAEEVGPETDLYAVGIILFLMLTGRLPFDVTEPVELLHAHLKTMPPRPSSLLPSLSPAVDQLVLGLLEKDRSKRPASAEVVRAALQGLTLERARSAVPEVELASLKSRSPALILGLVALVLGLGVAVFAVGLREPASPALTLPPKPPTDVPPHFDPPAVQEPAVPLPSAGQVVEPAVPLPSAAQVVEPAAPIPAPHLDLPADPVTAGKPHPQRVQRAALEKRVHQLSGELGRRASADDGPAPDAVAALNKLKLDLSVAKDSELARVSKLLDAWEREYLK